MATWLCAADGSALPFGVDSFVPARVIDCSSLASCDVYVFAGRIIWPAISKTNRAAAPPAAIGSEGDGRTRCSMRLPARCAVRRREHCGTRWLAPCERAPRGNRRFQRRQTGRRAVRAADRCAGEVPLDGRPNRNAANRQAAQVDKNAKPAKVPNGEELHTDKPQARPGGEDRQTSRRPC